MIVIIQHLVVFFLTQSSLKMDCFFLLHTYEKSFLGGRRSQIGYVSYVGYLLLSSESPGFCEGSKVDVGYMYNTGSLHIFTKQVSLV